MKKLSILGLMFIVAMAISLSGFAQTYAYQDFYGNWKSVEASEWPQPPKDAPPESKLSQVSYTLVFWDLANGTGVGFDDPTEGLERRNTADAVADYLFNDVLGAEAGAVDIEFATSINDATSGILAQGGTFFPQIDGFTSGVAYEHITTGVDPAGTLPDINVAVNFAHDYNSGTDPVAPSEVDLFTVLLHEITHGLGISSLSNATGESEFFAAFGKNTYTVWDDFLFRQSPSVDLWSAGGVFNGVPDDLISNDLIFTGPSASSFFGLGNPPIHSPDPYKDGSSLSHFVQDVTGGSLMVPNLGSGVQIRTYRDLDVGALQDLGYNALAVHRWKEY